MKDGPDLSAIAALIGDPARANMLVALMDGRALTVSELAGAAGVTLQTASGHLQKMAEAALLTVERQGRHRYYRLSDSDVAEVMEGLMGLAQRAGHVRVRTGPRAPELRQSRLCYDHLAGERGVQLLDGLMARGWLSRADDPAETPVVTPAGETFFQDFGIDLSRLAGGRRPLCRRCLDWSERRAHLGGALGARLLMSMEERGWLQRIPGRVLRFTSQGQTEFYATFG